MPRPLFNSTQGNTFGAMRASMHASPINKPWMMKARNNYSQMPSKTFMSHNTGQWFETETVINK